MPGGAVITGTTDTARIEAPVTFKAYMMCAFAAFGGIFFGYDTGWMGGVLGMKYFIRQYTGKAYPEDVFPDTSSKEYLDYKLAFKIPASDQSLVTSILSAGTFFGAIAAGDIADFIGRRLTIIMGCGIFMIGCILETVSTGIAVMTVGRLIAGVGVGFVSAIIILYMSEIAPKKVRGAIVSGYQFCITIGILLSNCVVYSSQGRDDTGSVSFPSYLPAVSLLTPSVPYSNCNPVPLGYHPCHWTLPPPRVSTLFRQEGCSRQGCQGIGFCSWSEGGFRLHPG